MGPKQIQCHCSSRLNCCWQICRRLAFGHQSLVQKSSLKRLWMSRFDRNLSRDNPRIKTTTDIRYWLDNIFWVSVCYLLEIRNPRQGYWPLYERVFCFQHWRKRANYVTLRWGIVWDGSYRHLDGRSSPRCLVPSTRCCRTWQCLPSRKHSYQKLMHHL